MMARPNNFYHSQSDEDLKKVYFEKFNGQTRTEVEKKDSIFIKELRSRDLISIIDAKCKPNNFYSSEENILKEAMDIMEKEKWDKLPTQDVLSEAGYSTILYGAKKVGGLRNLRILLGEEVDKILREPGEIKREARCVKEKEGWDRLPDIDYLREKGYGYLGSAISKRYPGMFTKLRKDLGEADIKKLKGHWEKEILFAEAIKIKEKEGWDELPSRGGLKGAGYKKFLSAATKNYPGSLSGLRRDLGEEVVETMERDYWDKDIVFEETGRLKELHGWEILPGGKRLQNLGYGGFANAISKHYPGNYPGLRKDLGEVVNRKDTDYWNQKTVFNDSREFLEKEGFDELPIGKVLQKKGYGGLVSAIARHYPGGIAKLRNDLNKEMGRLSEGEALRALLEGYVGGGDGEE